MRQLVPCESEGYCKITELPTRYKYNGDFIFLGFLIAANKLCAEYPEKSFDEALEIILSAQIYRNALGEDKMSIAELKKTESWKHKLAKFFVG